MQLSPFGFTKILVLMICIAITLFQSYLELDIYSKNQIYSATSVEGVDKAPVLLVFCDSDPYENKVKNDLTTLTLIVKVGEQIKLPKFAGLKFNMQIKKKHQLPQTYYLLLVCITGWPFKNVNLVS